MLVAGTIVAVVLRQYLANDRTGVEGHQAAASKPATARACVDLLHGAVPDKPALIESVTALIRKGDPGGKNLDKTPADLMVVSYREKAGVIDDVVVQLYQPSEDGMVSVLNPEGVVRARLGDELFGSAQTLMGLLYEPTVYLGATDEVERQQRAFQAGITGDLTLLREQTIEPLRVVAVMPRAQKFLPGSLRARVDSVVVNSELTFGEWRSRVALLTDNKDTAAQVGNTVAAWREMAVTLADTFASHTSGRPLREALAASTVQIDDNRVIATAAISSRAAVRVTNELAGHGGGCPPCPRDPSKVLICHKEHAKPDRTLCVAPNAVPAHLAHGDTCGACPNGGAVAGGTGLPGPNGWGNGPSPSGGGNGNGDGNGHGPGGGPASLVGCSAAFFKNVAHWPNGITQLTLGSVTYSKSECIEMLKQPEGKDASIDLAKQLIAAELNVIAGLPASEEVLAAITDADSLLAAQPGKLGFGIDPASPTGEEMTFLASQLRTYNQSCSQYAEDKGNNGLGNGADPQPPGNPPPNDTPTATPGQPGNKQLGKDSKGDRSGKGD